MSRRWEAIFLAGGTLEKAFGQVDGAPSKAYLQLNGRRMADYALDALKRVSAVRRIVAVIPSGAPAFDGTVSISGGRALFDSLSAGMDALLPETDIALIVTCDIPCVTTEGIENFISLCEENEECGLYYGIVSKGDSEKKFPGIPHTYIKLTEGVFCGSGLFAIGKNRFPRLKSLAENATRNRKNPIALAKLFGLRFIFNFLLRRVSIEDLEKRATHVFGFPVKGIPSRYPEIAFNVDDPESLKHASTFLPGTNHERERSD